MGPGTQPTKPAAAKPTKPAAAKPIKPAAAKPAPAPPPTQPQKQATQAKCDCPLAVHKPCDVDTLNIQFEHSVDDPDAPPDPATTAGSLPKKMEFAQAINRLRHNKVMIGNEPARDPALGAYDLVIETIADYNAAETPKSASFHDPGDIVTLKAIHAGFNTPDCPRDEHALLTVTAKTKAPEFKPLVIKRQGVSTIKHEQDHRLFGPTFLFDVHKMGSGAFVLFEWIISLFAASKPKEIEIVAQACGTRAKGATKPINRDIKALLRIHRRDKWTIGVKVPPLGQFKHEHRREADWNKPKQVFTDPRLTVTSGERRIGTSGRAYETTVDVDRGAGISGNAYGTLIGRRVERYSDQDGSAVRATRINRTGDIKFGFKAVTDRLAKPSAGFELVFARNDREIGSKDLIEAVQELKACVTNLALAMGAVKDLFKKVPQAGFKFEFSLSVLCGYAVVEWGPKNAACIDKRYWPVYTQFKLKLAMEIVNMRLALSFGVDVTCGGERWKTGIVVKIEGSLAFKIAIDKEIRAFQGPCPPKLKSKSPPKFGVAGDCQGELTPYASAYLAGYTVTDARAALTSGLEFKGEFVYDLPNKNIGLKGELKSKSLVLTASFKAPGWSTPRAIDPIEILKATSIYTFK